MNKKNAYYLLILCVSAALYTGCKSIGPEYPEDVYYTRNKADDSFIAKAGMYSLGTADLGETAYARTTDSTLLSFVEFVITDEQEAYTNLRNITFNNEIVPRQPNFAAEQKLLTDCDDSEFDSIYVDLYIHQVEAAIDLCQAEIQTGRHVVIIDYANQRLAQLMVNQRFADSVLKK